MAATTITLSASDKRRLQRGFIEEAVSARRRAGKKVPSGYHAAFKSKSPTAIAWRGIVANRPARGRSGGDVVEEWLHPVFGRLRFTALFGPRPHRGRAGCERKNTSKPWGPKNFRWVKPREGSVAEPREVVTARAERRQEHVKYLVRIAKDVHGIDLSPQLFARDGANQLYVIWRGIIARCENPKHHQYRDYGGRGIGVDVLFGSLNECGFEDYVFYVYTCPQLGPRPGPEYSTERINVDLGYERDNLTWATPEVQQANRRKVVEPWMTAGEKAEARQAEIARTRAVKERRLVGELLAHGVCRIGEDGSLEPVPEDEAATPPKPWPDAAAGEVGW